LLGRPEARTVAAFGAISGVRQLRNGGILVNDAGHRQLIVFDSALKTFNIIAGPGAINRYPAAGLPLIPYLGDSTLLVDFGSRALIVVGPTGRIEHTIPLPDVRELPNMIGAGTDAAGNLIYQAAPSLLQRARTISGPGAESLRSDSVPIIRAHLGSRRIDTLSQVKVNVFHLPTISLDSNGRRIGRQIVNPVQPAIDEWSVLSDGAIGIVRGLDYHVDWISADGTRTSTPRMPFAWRKLSVRDKQLKLDSARRIIDSLAAVGKGASRIMLGGRGASGTRRMADTVPITTTYVPLEMVGDFAPPIRAHSAKPDADGNLWILPTTSPTARDGLLYDIVNRKGEIAERVQLPHDRDIVGFGRNGIVYLSWRDGGNGYYVERTRVIRAAAAK
jgi:hypothetical protein